MSDVILQLPLDRTGRSPNNLIGSEEHPLVPIAGFPYKMVVLDHGGFYVKSLRVYDADYNKLVANQDYIVTYVYKNASDEIGLDICGAIVFLDPARNGVVFCSAQMVGGDLCYSFTVVDDYVNFYKSKPQPYTPKWMDYVGNEPIWKPGELEKERWHLDTYQPFNNEIERIAVTVEGGDGVEEDDFRAKVDFDFEAYVAKFNDRLERHIADKANPHVDYKSHPLIDLGRVENYPVASEAEAVAGTRHDLYMTPYLTSLSLDEWALKPLRAHIANKNNPHEVTIAQTGAVTKQQVDDLASTKYTDEETVVNSNYASWNGSLRSYNYLYDDFRKDLRAEMFAYGGAAGYVPPSRIGRGAPTAKKVLMSDGMWTDFDALTTIYITEISPTCVIVTGQPGWATAVNTPEAMKAPVGSLLFYNYPGGSWWGVGNGAGYVGWTNVQAGYKTAGGWIAL